MIPRKQEEIEGKLESMKQDMIQFTRDPNRKQVLAKMQMLNVRTAEEEARLIPESLLAEAVDMMIIWKSFRIAHKDLSEAANNFLKKVEDA